MYPHAGDLINNRVQRYTDHGLFGIVNNRIRFTGMLGSGKLEIPDHIWVL
jgi:hypothetical protein